MLKYPVLVPLQVRTVCILSDHPGLPDKRIPTVTERNHEGGIPLFYYADLCMNKNLLILVDFEVDM